MQWLDVISLAISIFVPFLIFIGRNWLTARISEGVKHKFSQELEQVKSELRTTEEKLKSEIRQREAEIGTLRESVIMVRQNRQQVLDKRKIEAIEKLWGAVQSFAPYKHISSMLPMLNFEEVTKAAARDKQKIQLYFKTLMGNTPDLQSFNPPIELEQPFVTPLAWALFTAYRASVMHSYAVFKLFSLGIDDAMQLLNNSKVPELMKAAMPEYASYIDQHGIGGCTLLLDQLAENLLSECKRMLEGKEEDKASAERVVAISKLITEYQKQEIEAEVPPVPNN